jgi:hypothetical protein
MTDLTPQEKREQTLLKRLGSPEAVKEHYRRAQAKSRKNYSGNGGLRSLTLERRKEIAMLGVEARNAKKQAKENA